MPLLVALIALLVLAPSAHADGRLVHAFDADSEIQSTGNGFAWTTDAGHVRVTDAQGRTIYDVRPGTGCSSRGATRARVALVLCDYKGYRLANDVQLLDTATGALSPLRIDGDPSAIGRWWIHSSYNPGDCYHCEDQVYTNWRTGERREDEGIFAPERDLDDPSLRRYRAPYRVRGKALLVRRGDAWRQFARCRVACHDILVWRRRAAYLDGRRLIERRPRQTTRWRLSRTQRRASLHRAGNALVLQRGAQVWRAER